MKFIKKALILISIIFLSLPITAQAKTFYTLSITDISVKDGTLTIQVHTNKANRYYCSVEIIKMDDPDEYTYTYERFRNTKNLEIDISEDIQESGIYQFNLALTNTANDSTYAFAQTYKNITVEDNTFVVSNYNKKIYKNITSSDKKVIKKLMSTFFKNVKNYNPYGIDACFKGPQKECYIYNPVAINYLRQTNKKAVKYKIISVQVKGNTAKLKVNVTNYDSYTPVYKALRSVFQDCLRKRSFANIDFYKMFDLMTRYSKKDYDLCNRDVTINLVKSSGKWKIDKMSKTLQSITDSGILSTVNYLFKHPSMLIF